MSSPAPLPPGVTIRGEMKPGFETVLTPQAIAFVVELERKFGAERKRLLAERDDGTGQARSAAGSPTSSRRRRAIRDADWTVAPLPEDLLDRRVEITGPVDRKMIINALNSGANVFMADFEDASTPTWDNLIEGQINLRDAIAGTITFDDPANGKHYKLNRQDRRAAWCGRAAGICRRSTSSSTARRCRARCSISASSSSTTRRRCWRKGSGPYFYLPKLESAQEARLWNEVFVHAQAALGLPKGTIKATVLIETILAAFEMDEILYELRDHSAGLNCGRWDYIYSFIKKFAERSRRRCCPTARRSR